MYVLDLTHGRRHGACRVPATGSAVLRRFGQRTSLLSRCTRMRAVGSTAPAAGHAGQTSARAGAASIRATKTAAWAAALKLVAPARRRPRRPHRRPHRRTRLSDRTGASSGTRTAMRPRQRAAPRKMDATEGWDAALRCASHGNRSAETRRTGFAPPGKRARCRRRRRLRCPDR